MKKTIITTIVLLLSIAFSARAQMSDVAIAQYVQKELKAGTSTEKIGQELLAKGVTPEQLKRIKSRLESGKQLSSSVTESSEDEESDATASRKRKKAEPEDDFSKDSELMDFLSSSDDFMEDEEDTDEKKDKDAREEKAKKPVIFGHDVFGGRLLSFEPNENLATPPAYKLGPGDEVIIDIWGDSETTMRREISPEGKIHISGIGPVYLSGLTVKDAEARVRKLASRIADIGGENSSSDISLTLGQMRTISVNVVGEAKTPGTYRLSPFSTVFTALYRAGGVTEIGSLRNIRLVRGGKELPTVDVYGYLFNGTSDTDQTLAEGDIIIIPPYTALVDIEGNVRRPMFYEVAEGETLDKLIGYAGGLGGDAFKDEVNVARRTGTERRMFTVKSSDFASFVLEDCDSVGVSATLERYANKVTVEGAVYRPGDFELGGDIATVRQLIEHAGGAMPEALMARAIITREKDNLQHETIAFDLGGVVSGTAQDVMLRRNDVVKVFKEDDIVAKKTITVEGCVAEPGELPFAEGTTIEDAILMAGGMLKGASTSKVDVSRILSNPSDTKASKTVSQSFSLSISDGFVIGGDSFELMPYDVIIVHEAPGFNQQLMVTLTGEVQFEGQYALDSKETRLSDIIGKAGGLTETAYRKGASLIRVRPENELTDIAEAGFAKKATKEDEEDSTQIFTDTYVVGIALDKALENPGSEYDMVLKEGDTIFIPEYDGTVKIVGSVMRENAVQYVKGKSKSYYVNRAGGYADGAARGRAYIMYMNGSVAKGNTGVKIEPGCTIYVPQKPEKEKMSGAEIISMGSTAVSLATIMLYLVSMVKSM